MSRDFLSQTVLIFVGVLIVYAPLLGGYSYLQDRLGQFFRRWLTNSFLDNYSIPERAIGCDLAIWLILLGYRFLGRVKGEADRGKER